MVTRLPQRLELGDESKPRCIHQVMRLGSSLQVWSTSRPVVEAIFRLGMPLLAFPNRFALGLAEFCWFQFDCVGNHLNADLKFMKEAVDRNGQVLQYADSAVFGNFGSGGTSHGHPSASLIPLQQARVGDARG